MAKFDACLATVVEESCPAAAIEPLRIFLASHDGITNQPAYGIQSLGCVYEAVGIRAPKVNNKAILACSLRIAETEKVNDWYMALGKANSVLAEFASARSPRVY